MGKGCRLTSYSLWTLLSKAEYLPASYWFISTSPFSGKSLQPQSASAPPHKSGHYRAPVFAITLYRALLPGRAKHGSTPFGPWSEAHAFFFHATKPGIGHIFFPAGIKLLRTSHGPRLGRALLRILPPPFKSVASEPANFTPKVSLCPFASRHARPMRAPRRKAVLPSTLVVKAALFCSGLTFSQFEIFETSLNSHRKESIHGNC